MNEFMQSIVSGSDLSKAVFLMAVGITFVFAVQLVFYIVIRIFTGKKYNRDQDK